MTHKHKNSLEGIKLLFDDTIALVIQPQDKEYKIVCVTEYRKDGTWMCGVNLITSIKRVLKTAEEKGLSIFFENRLHKKEE